MTPSLHNTLENLAHQYPDWKSWLTVIQEVLRETSEPKWDTLVPAPVPQKARVPLLQAHSVAVEPSLVYRWTERLIQTAYKSGAPKMATLKPTEHSRLDALSLFQASLRQDEAQLNQIAKDLTVDSDALQTVAALVPVPFLHACNRRWAGSVAESWQEGYCPICGAWPAFAEVRGIERSRYLRCGRCGAGWKVHGLSCPYCGMTDHNQLVSLVPEKGGSMRVVEACNRCHGYIKSFTTLQGSPPSKVVLDDLESVDLDVAALAQGYKRPQGLGYSLEVTTIAKPTLKGKIFSWKA